MSLADYVTQMQTAVFNANRYNTRITEKQALDLEYHASQSHRLTRYEGPHAGENLYRFLQRRIRYYTKYM